MKTLKAILFLLILINSIPAEISSQPFLEIGPHEFEASKVIMYLNPDTCVLNSSGTQASYGQTVYKWIDLGPNKFVFQNTINSRRPDYTSENGRNYLNFSLGDFLENTIIKDSVNSLDEFSIFIVVKSNVINTDNGFLDSEDPDGNDDVISLRYDADGLNSGRVNCLKASLNSNNANNQVETQSNTQTTEHQVLTITWKRFERTYVYINGIVSDSSNSTYSGVISDVKKIIIGKGPKDNSLSRGWNGKIGTILFFKQKYNPQVVHDIADVLPVGLISFKAVQENNCVKLNWMTACEFNNSHYTIEKSKDGIDFNFLTTITGAGSSSSANNYEYIDNYCQEGIFYYRLKQTDFDGTCKIIAYATVEFNALHSNSFQIYPNPVSIGSNINVVFENYIKEKEYTLIIQNSSGINLYNINIDNNEFVIPSEILTNSGIYYISIISDFDKTTKRIVVL